MKEQYLKPLKGLESVRQDTREKKTVKRGSYSIRGVSHEFLSGEWAALAQKETKGDLPDSN